MTLMRSIIFLIFVSFAVNGQAHVIHSKDGVHKVELVQSSTGSRSGQAAGHIQICNNSSGTLRCQSFPKISPHLFKGTLDDWNFFFNRCAQFDEVNNMYDITTLLVTLALMPKLGLVKTMAAEIGLSFIGQPPYPEGVNKEVMEKAFHMVKFLVRNENKEVRIHSRYILALESIMPICSERLHQDYIVQRGRQCLSGCHRPAGGGPSPSEQPVHGSEKWKSPELLFHSDTHAPTEKIKEYLEYVSH